MRVTLVGLLLAASAASPAAADVIGYIRTTATLPVVVSGHPTDPNIQFVAEQGGRIRVVRVNANGVWYYDPDLLNLGGTIGDASGEQGLLGFALAPDFASSGRFFVSFTNPSGEIVVSRFRASGLIADPQSRFDLRWGGAGGPRSIAQPQPTRHGGSLAFGPGGALWVALGDAGSPLSAQDDAQLLGKLLALDVNVPDSDPIGYRAISRPGSGLRNPRGLSFDPAYGAMFFGDAGEAWQEINVVGPHDGVLDFGWPYRDGAQDSVLFPPPPGFRSTDPVWRYSSSVGSAVAGGMVYRGHSLSDFYGRYFFADSAAGRVWSLAVKREAPPLERIYLVDLKEHSGEIGYTNRPRITAFGTSAPGGTACCSYDRHSDFLFTMLSPSGFFTLEPDTRFGHPQLPRLAVTADMDGDNRSDFLIWRRSSGKWYWTTSSSGYTAGDIRTFGVESSADVPLDGDVDGDGKADLILWRANTGTWEYSKSSTGFLRSSTTGFALTETRQFGNAALGDVPFTGHFISKLSPDVAVWRASTGTWYWSEIFAGSTRGATKQFGNNSLGDVPLLGDIDGDGLSDLIVWRRSTGRWYWTTSSSGYTDGSSLQFGDQMTNVVPLVGDVDGDGKADLLVWGTDNSSGVPGRWAWRTSSTNYAAGGSTQWGNPGLGDVPRVMDVTGDGEEDLVIWRPGNGTWYVKPVRYINYGVSVEKQFGNGALGDVPVIK